MVDIRASAAHEASDNYVGELSHKLNDALRENSALRLRIAQIESVVWDEAVSDCAAMLEAGVQDLRRQRDPGLANHLQSWATKLRTLLVAREMP